MGRGSSSRDADPSAWGADICLVAGWVGCGVGGMRAGCYAVGWDVGRAGCGGEGTDGARESLEYPHGQQSEVGCPWVQKKPTI